MDKKELKDLISTLNTNDKITVNFRGDLSNLNGDYFVINVKKGKGKGGSLLMELKPTSSEDTIVVGTPNSDTILNVIVNGKLHGYESEDGVPLVIKPDANRASALKEFLRSCKENTNIKLSSSLLLEFNGVFTVMSVKPSKGRYGQVVAKLSNNIELWSYRHSGAIDSFEKV